MMRNFANSKIMMFKPQNYGSPNPFVGWNFIFLEFSKKEVFASKLLQLHKTLEKRVENASRIEKNKKNLTFILLKD
jgi:transposase